MKKLPNGAALLVLPQGFEPSPALDRPETNSCLADHPGKLADQLNEMVKSGRTLGLMGLTPTLWPGERLLFAACLWPTRAFHPARLAEDCADLLAAPVPAGQPGHPGARRLTLAKQALALALFFEHLFRLDRQFGPDLLALSPPGLMEMQEFLGPRAMETQEYQRQLAGHLGRLGETGRSPYWLEITGPQGGQAPAEKA